MTREQKERAGRAIAERVAEMQESMTAVAHAARIAPTTLRSIVRGKRWPTDAVQAQIEAALRWRPGEMTVRAVRTHADVTVAMLTDAELSAELTRRIRARDRRDARLRAADR